MLTLAIETSGPNGSVALSRDGTLIDLQNLEREGRRHAQTLVVTIKSLFDRAGLRPADCDVVGVSIGPGSFTGLRVGVVCAKTFAYGTDAKVVAIDTFEAIAAACPSEVAAVSVIDDAQRGDLYIGNFVRDTQGEFRRVGPIAVAEAMSWCQSRTSGEYICGPGIERVAAHFPSGIRCLPAEYRYPTARTIARLSEREAAAGNTADVWALEPFYIRKSTAEEKWESTHGPAQK